MPLALIAALLALAGAPASAETREALARSVRGAWDAQDRCPEACAREDAVWTGGWRPLGRDGDALCDCRRGR